MANRIRILKNSNPDLEATHFNDSVLDPGDFLNQTNFNSLVSRTKTLNIMLQHFPLKLGFESGKILPFQIRNTVKTVPYELRRVLYFFLVVCTPFQCV